MSWLGRNDLDGPLGMAAEEQRRRVDEQAATAQRRVVAEHLEATSLGRERRPGWMGTILARIRRALGR